MAALGMLVLAGCESAEPDQPTEKSSQQADDKETKADDKRAATWTDDDLEYKLAVIDEGGFVDYDDPRMDEYKAEIDKLAPKCSENRTRLGDMSVVAIQTLDEETPGHSENTLSILKAANTAAADVDRWPGGKCSDLFATLVTVMTS